MYMGSVDDVHWLAEVQDLIDPDGELCLAYPHEILLPSVTGRLLTDPEPFPW